MIVGILLSALHALLIPTLLLIFGMAIQHFGDHYNTFGYFHCIQSDDNITCSVVQLCSNVSNQRGCCMDDTFECINNNTLLEKLDVITVLCIITGVFLFIFSWIHASIFHYVGNNQMLRIRKQLFRSFVNQDITWFDLNESREITSRMTG